MAQAAREYLREPRHGQVRGLDAPSAGFVGLFERQASATGIGSLELRAVRSDHQNVGGELPDIAMYRQVETLGQQRLQQGQHLVLTGDLGIGLGQDVKAFLLEPLGSRDLVLGNTVGSPDDRLKREVGW
jgi:hypothetical protein